ncbi:hypothetical protein EfmAA610_17330 [Enterococcus faecium]|nr:hypothetical protein EfmAA610_17330 [Enterococcus faecium]
MKDMAQLLYLFGELQHHHCQRLHMENFRLVLAIVSEGRNKSEEEVKKIADGRIYDGVQAKEVGLVDELGFPEDALKAIRKEQQLEDAELVEYSST